MDRSSSFLVGPAYNWVSLSLRRISILYDYFDDLMIEDDKYDDDDTDGRENENILRMIFKAR